MFVDPSSGTDHDETAWAVIGLLNGYLYLYLYVLDVGGHTGRHDAVNTSKLAKNCGEKP